MHGGCTESPAHDPVDPLLNSGRKLRDNREARVRIAGHLRRLGDFPDWLEDMIGAFEYHQRGTGHCRVQRSSIFQGDLNIGGPLDDQNGDVETGARCSPSWSCCS